MLNSIRKSFCIVFAFFCVISLFGFIFNSCNSAEAAPNRVFSIVKDVPSQVQGGQPLTCTIKITNLSDLTIKDVKLVETLPKNFVLESSDPASSDGSEGGTEVWQLGDFRPNETKSIKLSGIAQEAGEISFCSNITYSLPPVCAESNIVQPVLAIEKRAPSVVSLCDTIPMSIRVSNSGSGVAKNVIVTDSLPSGLQTVDGKTNLKLDIGSLAPGQEHTTRLNVRASGTGTYENSASVEAFGGISADSNTTTTVVQQPVLQITKKSPGKRYLGRNIEYGISVSNVGDGAAESTVIRDTIPNDSTFVSASDGGTYSSGFVTWNLGTLPPQESRNVSLVVHPNSIQEYCNKATVSATCADEVAATSCTEVAGIPAVLLEVVDVDDPIEVGATETYIVSVINQGSATGTNITIVCEVEGETMELVSSTGATKGSIEGNIITFDPLPELAAKAKASWEVVVKALNSGDVRFKVELNSDQITRPVQETESTNFYQ